MIHLGIQGITLPAPQDARAEPPQPGLPATGDAPASAAQLQAAVGPRFEVLEPIALGGMATIYQLRHREHGGLFVAKVLHRELITRPEVVRSFRREAIHAARLGDHPNAIPILDAGESDGLCFLLMPFIEGEDLDQLLQNSGPLPRADALHLAAQISSLLCHAESHNITHCDIAPGNIRLDVFGRYRLMDFGISHATDDCDTRPLGGTPLYSSPEQLRGDTPDIRADIYALGLVLAEALTGHPVLVAATLDDLRARHLRGDWSLPASLLADEHVARLLRHMTATRREERFSSAFELSGALAALGFERPEFAPRTLERNSAGPARERRSRLS